MVTVAVIALLIALNALFVAAEFAIVGARKEAVDQRAQAGSLSARRVARILAKPVLQDRYIATAQLGITIASLGLGMYGEHQIAGWIEGALGTMSSPEWLATHAVASVAAVVILTYFHIVLGEMVPKAVALSSAERWAVWLTPLMSAVQLATLPVVAGLTAVGNRALKWAGVASERPERAYAYSAEEMQYIVRESEEWGKLSSESAQVLEELLEFGRLTAWEAMTPRVKIRGVEVGTGVAELVATVREAPHTRYPVFAHDLDHIVGLIHIKDVLRRLREGRALAQADIRPVPFVPGSATLNRVLQVMRAERVHMVVVMDEHGGTDGIMTLEDLFEEVVGEIEDVTAARRPPIFTDDRGALHVAGTVRVEELGEHIGRDLEHEEVDTVSGLVLALLDRPPRVGDVVTFEQVELEVRGVEGHGVTECVVRVLPRPAEAARRE